MPCRRRRSGGRVRAPSTRVRARVTFGCAPGDAAVDARLVHRWGSCPRRPRIRGVGTISRFFSARIARACEVSARRRDGGAQDGLVTAAVPGSLHPSLTEERPRVNTASTNGTTTDTEVSTATDDAGGRTMRRPHRVPAGRARWTAARRGRPDPPRTDSCPPPALGGKLARAPRRLPGLPPPGDLRARRRPAPASCTDSLTSRIERVILPGRGPYVLPSRGARRPTSADPPPTPATPFPASAERPRRCRMTRPARASCPGFGPDVARSDRRGGASAAPRAMKARPTGFRQTRSTGP